MTESRAYQCRDCKTVYRDRTGDHCPECGGADVIPVPIGSPTDPIPNVGTDAYLRMDDGNRLIIEFEGKEWEIVTTEDGLELRSPE